ncbi:MAG: TetR/AcrR family transcriptional regulator [Clostridia bacterium]|nr:TetR/AcrR family transcriptional regulator [Clostridia bacterium]
MTKKHEDRRTAYSKKVIRESLLELMQDKPLNKITVKEICDRADVNRSTFYAYYEDIYDLHRAILRDYFRCQHHIVGEGKRIFSSHPDITALSVADFYEFFLSYFTTVMENKELFRFVFNQNTNASIHVNLRKLFYRQLTKMLPEDVPEKIRSAFYASFIFECGGVTFLLMEWLNNGCRMPVETLAKRAAYFSNGVFNGYRTAQ